MKIVLYLGNNVGPKIDARNIEKGNPGVGGAHYCILMLAHYLSKNIKYNVYVITVRDYILNDNISVIKVNGDEDVVPVSNKIGADILILKQFPGSILERHIKDSKLKVIVWSHNFISSDFCNYICSTTQIKRNVFVGKQQYDTYIDDNVIKKSTFIYNMVSGMPTPNNVNTEHIVVFLGAICNKKGFLEMCRIWPGVLRDVPDAKLFVIGSGKLYGDAKLGRYGIAEEKYEQKFIPFITDKSGELLPSVKFLGVLGEEKSDIFGQACVGVVNPSGARETFGMSVIEMGLAGLPTVTLSSPGYYDTIQNGENGFIVKSLPQLQQKIVNLLLNNELRNSLRGGVIAKAIKFSPNKILSQWEVLLDEVYNDIPNSNKYKVSKPFLSNYKWLRIIIRILRFKIGLKILPSSIKLEKIIKIIISKIH